MSIFHRPVAALVLASAMALGAATSTLPAAAATTGEGIEIVNVHETARVTALWFARNGTDLPWTAASMSTGVGPKSYSRFTMTETRGCYYDFKIRFSDGYEQTFTKVNVCTFDKLIAS